MAFLPLQMLPQPPASNIITATASKAAFNPDLNTVIDNTVGR